MTTKRRLLIVIPVVLIAAIVVAALVWDWNWFRPMLEHRASTALGRKVTLRNFDVKIGWHPLLIADGIVVANPPDFPADTQFGSIEKLRVRIDLRALLHRQIHLLEINAERPRGDLRPGPNGEPNWKFNFGSKGGAGAPLEIGSVNISDGNIKFFDPQYKTDLTLMVHTEPPKNGQDSTLLIDAKGTYAKQPITARFIGGSVLSLREPGHPYPVNLEAQNGPTVITLRGTIERPLQLAGADLDLFLRGKNLAALYPLTGVPLPPSGPYTLKGKLDYTDERIRFLNFAGVVGKSDLGGNLELDLKREKRLVTAVLHSKSVDMADLAGFTGAKPRKPTTNDHWRVLPDKPINVPRIRAADLDIHYKVAHFKNKKAPVDDLVAHIIVQNGFMNISPLSFGVAQGRIVANVKLDGRRDVLHSVADVDFRQVDLGRLLRDSKVAKGAGLIGGTARIESTGNSTAKLLANGDGELRLFMSQGDLSALLVDLAGLEFGNALMSALGLPSRTEVRCAVSDFQLQQGVLKPKILVVDTEAANVLGEGLINLQNETVDFRLRTEPKHAGILSLHAPVQVRGQLKKPEIKPEKKKIVTRGAAAVALGVLVTPLAALLPTIELGLGKDNNCAAAIGAMKAGAPAKDIPLAKAPQ
jgi:AsmA family protein